ncbi:MAG: Ig domain-containing protein [Candidatus Omnitrophota bacterium]
MQRISGRLFPVVCLIGLITVTGVGMVNAADVAPEENSALLENCGSDSVVSDTQMAIITTSLPAGAAGTAYSQKVQASGGIAPYSWSISAGSLPAGLSLNASTGAITGTLKIAGASRFTVRVTDSQNPAENVTKTLSVAVNPPVLGIITASFPDGAVRVAYSQRLQATGGFFPYSWSISAGSLPAGLSLNASTGAITGTPKTTGTSKFTVRVTDSQNPAVSVTANLSIKIEPSVLPKMWFSPI